MPVTISDIRGYVQRPRQANNYTWNSCHISAAERNVWPFCAVLVGTTARKMVGYTRNNQNPISNKDQDSLIYSMHLRMIIWVNYNSFTNLNYTSLHHGKLTWQWKNSHLKMYLTFKWGCNSVETSSFAKKMRCEVCLKQKWSKLWLRNTNFNPLYFLWNDTIRRKPAPVNNYIGR